MSGARANPAPYESKFVTTNGVRLNYLDWGGRGPNLVLIHGATGNPHCFDDLVPMLTDRFRVIAYARRGHGQSELKGPFDVRTLTEDFRGVMDALGIARAHLAGHSYGGCEITGMASTHPKRVDRIVYLDAGYDWSDQSWQAAMAAWPFDINFPPKALRSIRALLDFAKAGEDPRVVRSAQFEPYLRDQVRIRKNGTLKPLWTTKTWKVLEHNMFGNPRRDYSKVHVPALAIYATRFFDSEFFSAKGRKMVDSWERTYIVPFRAASMERIRRELRGVRVESVSGGHGGFLVTAKDRVAELMREFLVVPAEALAAH